MFQLWWFKFVRRKRKLFAFIFFLSYYFKRAQQDFTDISEERKITDVAMLRGPEM